MYPDCTDWIDMIPGEGHVGAHRGVRACFPENTIAAFATSLGKCNFIELDVRLSRDREPVVINDSMLFRTSDFHLPPLHLAHPDGKVVNLDVSELKTLDMGSWFVLSDPFATISSGIAPKSVLSELTPQCIQRP